MIYAFLGSRGSPESYSLSLTYYLFIIKNPISPKPDPNHVLTGSGSNSCFTEPRPNPDHVVLRRSGLSQPST